MKRRNVEPPKYTPKFHAGDRVRISAEGLALRIADPGTEGTVEMCGLVVRVIIDGTKEATTYSTDFWDAVPKQ